MKKKKLPSAEEILLRLKDLAVQHHLESIEMREAYQNAIANDKLKEAKGYAAVGKKEREREEIISDIVEKIEHEW